MLAALIELYQISLAGHPSPLLVPQHPNGVSQGMVGLGRIRLDAQGLPEAGRCFFRQAQFSENVAQVDVCRHEVRLEEQGVSKAGRRLLQKSLVAEDEALVVVGLGVSRIGLQDVPVKLFGLPKVSGLIMPRPTAVFAAVRG